MSLVGDRASNPMQAGAVIFLDAAEGLELDRGLGSFGARAGTVPRLHQLLVDVPFGCGRPIWIDDPDFLLAERVSIVECPCANDEEAVLEIAARGEYPASSIPSPLVGNRGYQCIFGIFGTRHRARVCLPPCNGRWYRRHFSPCGSGGRRRRAARSLAARIFRGRRRRLSACKKLATAHGDELLMGDA